MIVFLSLILFLFMLVMFMTTKRKSTPARNPLRSEASLSSDSAPLSLRFHDDDAHKAFSKNFSRRGVHSECQVILVDFTDIDLPTVIHSQEWESLCDIPITCPLVLIQEFYSNMHEIDHWIPLFFTRIWGRRIPVTLQLVADVLRQSDSAAPPSYSTPSRSAPSTSIPSFSSGDMTVGDVMA